MLTTIVQTIEEHNFVCWIYFWVKSEQRVNFQNKNECSFIYRPSVTGTSMFCLTLIEAIKIKFSH